jgi:hypothetical protein
MTRKWLVLGAAFAIASGWHGAAAAQRGELEVTMRVLDDASGVDAVLVALDDPAPAEDTARETSGAGREDSAAEAESREERGAERFADREVDDLDPQREETEEGAIEDRDLAEDLEETEEEPEDVAEE